MNTKTSGQDETAKTPFMILFIPERIPCLYASRKYENPRAGTIPSSPIAPMPHVTPPPPRGDGGAKSSCEVVVSQ